MKQWLTLKWKASLPASTNEKYNENSGIKVSYFTILIVLGIIHLINLWPFFLFLSQGPLFKLKY